MQFINFSDNTASIVQVTIPVSTVQLAYRRDVWWFEAICAFLERERTVIHLHCLWKYVSQKVFKLL